MMMVMKKKKKKKGEEGENAMQIDAVCRTLFYTCVCLLLFFWRFIERLRWQFPSTTLTATCRGARMLENASWRWPGRYRDSMGAALLTLLSLAHSNAQENSIRSGFKLAFPNRSLFHVPMKFIRFVWLWIAFLVLFCVRRLAEGRESYLLFSLSDLKSVNVCSLEPPSRRYNILQLKQHHYHFPISTCWKHFILLNHISVYLVTVLVTANVNIIKIIQKIYSWYFAIWN